MFPETKAQAREAAARGADVLDEQVPGWHDLIEREKLDVRGGVYWTKEGANNVFQHPRTSVDRPCGCILAQLDASERNGYGEFFDRSQIVAQAAQSGPERCSWLAEHGFVVGDRFADELRDAWIAEIDKRAEAMRRLEAGELARWLSA